MKCPKAIAWDWKLGHEPEFVYGDCLKEECAWWTPLSSCCAFRDLPGILIAIGNTLGEMAEELHVDVTVMR